MLYISTELQRIATLLECDYLRAASMGDANIQSHYKDFNRPTIFYVGFGISTNNNPNTTEEYEEPLARVTSTVYVLVKKNTMDGLASTTDVELTVTANICGKIIHYFDEERSAPTYTLEPVQEYDDMLIGYKMTVVFTIPANGC